MLHSNSSIAITVVVVYLTFLTHTLTVLSLSLTLTLTEVEEEKTEEEKKVFKQDFAVMRETISSYQKEIELLAKNKNMSSAFEWIPNQVPNRKQRKQYAKMRNL